MELINCPNCKNEINETHKVCSECDNNLNDSIINKDRNNKFIKIKNYFKKNPKNSIFAIIGVFIVLIISILSITILIPNQKYNSAIELANEGNYNEAVKKLESIENYKDAKKIKEQLIYESYLFSGLDNLIYVLKDHSSLIIKDLELYTKDSIEYPKLVLTYSAKNGFGGFGISYCIIEYDSEKDKKYNYLGSCDSRNSDDYENADTKSELIEKLVCLSIDITELTYEKIDTKINIDRVNNILSTKNYSNIKMIKNE